MELNGNENDFEVKLSTECHWLADIIECMVRNGSVVFVTKKNNIFPPTRAFIHHHAKGKTKRIMMIDVVTAKGDGYLPICDTDFDVQR